MQRSAKALLAATVASSVSVEQSTTSSVGFGVIDHLNDTVSKLLFEQNDSCLFAVWQKQLS